MHMNKLLNKLKSIFSKDRDILLKIFFTSITRAISAFGTFVFNFVLAKVLGVDDFGTFMLMYTIVIGLGFIIRYGYANAIMRFGAILYADHHFFHIKQIKNKVFRNTMLISIVVGIILIFGSNLIAENYLGIEDPKIVILFAFSLPFFSYLSIQSSYLKAFKKPQLAPFIEVGLSTFTTGVIVGLIALLGFNVDMNVATICFLISSIFIYFMGKLIIDSTVQKIKVEQNYLEQNDDKNNYDFIEFNQSLFDYFLNALINYILVFSPILILGIFVSSKEVGLYSIANSAAFVISFILWIFNTVYASDFAVLYKQNAYTKIISMVKRSIFYMSTIALPIFLFIISFPTFVLTIFGEEYAQAKYGLIVMAFAQLFNVLTGPLNFLLSMTGHQKRLRNIILITAILNIVSCFILIPLYGYFGAVIGASLGLVFQNILCFKHVEKILGQKIF